MSAVKPEILTDKETDPASVPLVGVNVNQLWLLLTVQLSVPPPEFEIYSVWLLGFAPPCTAEKEKSVGLTHKTGAGSSTVP